MYRQITKDSFSRIFDTLVCYYALIVVWERVKHVTRIELFKASILPSQLTYSNDTNTITITSRGIVD